MGRRQRLLLLWVCSMNLTAPVPTDDEVVAALLAESEVSPRTPAEFRGVGAVSAEELLQATQTAVADLGLSDEAVTADLAAAAAEDPAPAEALCVPAFRDEEEMLRKSVRMSAEWELQFITEARTDPFQVEADAAKEQEEIAAMEATIRSGPPVFVRMWEALTTNVRFSKIFVDRVRLAIFLRWDLLGRIHSAMGKAAEPKYPFLKDSHRTETSTSNEPRNQKVKCDKCPAYVSQRFIDDHRANCKGSTVVDIYMYFLAILLGISRCVRLSCVCSIARSCARLASALARSCMCVCACRNHKEDNSLILFLTNFVEGCNFTPQGTVTAGYFETWLTELYKTGIIVKGAMFKYDVKNKELQRAGKDKDAVQEALQKYALDDTDVFFTNKHEDPEFRPAVRHCCCCLLFATAAAVCNCCCCLRQQLQLLLAVCNCNCCLLFATAAAVCSCCCCLRQQLQLLLAVCNCNCCLLFATAAAVCNCCCCLRQQLQLLLAVCNCNCNCCLLFATAAAVCNCCCCCCCNCNCSGYHHFNPSGNRATYG
jgi:hypothetical protein